MEQILENALFRRNFWRDLDEKMFQNLFPEESEEFFKKKTCCEITRTNPESLKT